MLVATRATLAGRHQPSGALAAGGRRLNPVLQPQIKSVVCFQCEAAPSR